MIRSLTVRNFQSHKDTTIEFHPGFNAIVGSSDKGKSVLLRAIAWVAYNRPRGEDFRSSWSERNPTVVEIEMDDGNTIARVRTSTRKLYLLNGEELRSFRADVPDEV